MPDKGATNDCQYADDPSIGDEEWLLRGLLRRQFSGGIVSSAAFKPKEGTGPHSHLSVWREAHCDPQAVLATKLPYSIAFGRLTAEEPRSLRPEVVGVGLVDDGLAHARIIRHVDVDIDSDAWAAVAVLLAEACTVAHHREA